MKSADEADVQFLSDVTRATLDAARVYPDRETVTAHAGKNDPVRHTVGFTAICPAGGKAYPAIWVQDFTMGYSSGFVSIEEGRDHLRLIASCQNTGAERALPTGAIIPPHAIADHINLDGTPVLFKNR